MARRYFMFVMMTFGGSMVIATLLVAVRNRGDGTWAMAGLFAIASDIFMEVVRMPMLCKRRLLFLEAVRIYKASDVREKATDKLDVKEFRDRFCIPNGVIVELLNDEEVPTSTGSLRKIPLSSQRNNSTRAPLPSVGVVQGVPPFYQDSPVFIHPNIIRHVRAPALPSIGDGTARLYEGRGEGTRGGPGWMGGVLRASGEAFSPNYSLVIPGPERRGHIVDWVEKASIACLNKLFEIDAKERCYKTLLTARNLMAIVPGVPRESKEADVENVEHSWIIGRRKRTKGLFERLPDRNAVQPLLQIKIQRKRGSCGPGHVTGLNHSGTSLAAVARLANLADEAASSTIRAPYAGLSMQLKPLRGPMEEARAESQSQPLDDPTLLCLVRGHLQRGLARHAI
ncbi:hypothetical protein CK203_110042 [Vitis vinifera]|uniref:Uncharacterized protein n=1 Tax=Vitis vinifera TaxID=29760 RepID=A0A438DC74_VITVI|nr:hypothetical protein CK203_110042 [Vitis vinifera]